MKLNCDKTKEIVIDFRVKKTDIESISMQDTVIERVKSSKLLGVIISDDLGWEEHVNYICEKGSKRLYFIRVLKRSGVESNDLVKIFLVTIRSILEYACELWHPGLTMAQSSKIESLQKRAMRIIFPFVEYSEACRLAKVPPLSDRREQACKKMFLAMLKPSHKLYHIMPPPRSSQQALRSSLKYPLPKIRTERAKRSLVNYGLFNYQ